MNIFVIILLVLLTAWIALNVFIGITKSPHQMRYALIKNQNIVGIIFSNIFFCLAWIIQMFRGLWQCRDEHGFYEA